MYTCCLLLPTCEAPCSTLSPTRKVILQHSTYVPIHFSKCSYGSSFPSSVTEQLSRRPLAAIFHLYLPFQFRATSHLAQRGLRSKDYQQWSGKEISPAVLPRYVWGSWARITFLATAWRISAPPLEGLIQATFRFLRRAERMWIVKSTAPALLICTANKHGKDYFVLYLPSTSVWRRRWHSIGVILICQHVIRMRSPQTSPFIVYATPFSKTLKKWGLLGCLKVFSPFSLL